MAKLEHLSKERISSGDTAVSGLFNGLLAGSAMAVYLLLVGLLLGQGTRYMGYFASGAAVSPQLGILSHLAVSAVYGMLFGLILRWTRLGQFKSVPGWFTGLTYALLLWLAAILFILPGPGSLLKAIPVVHFLLAHIVYGLVLGLRQKAQAD